MGSAGTRRPLGRSPTVPAPIVPLMDACMGAETGASLSPIFSPIRTVCPDWTVGVHAAPMCWAIGISTSFTGVKS